VCCEGGSFVVTGGGGGVWGGGGEERGSLFFSFVVFFFGPVGGEGGGGGGGVVFLGRVEREFGRGACVGVGAGAGRPPRALFAAAILYVCHEPEHTRQRPESTASR